jgi:hypothetical protein
MGMRFICAILSAGLSLGYAMDGGAPASGDLFSSHTVVNVTLEAPLADLFSKAQSDAEYAVKGTLKIADAAGHGTAIENIDVSVRGNTSKQETECPFPKLKLRFPAGETDGSSVFGHVKAIKIGTHCAELPDGQLTPKYGRWANEKAPLREAFVYRLLETVQVTAFKARPARITYIDGGQKVTRNGFFLEDDHEAVKRLGATQEVTPEQFTDAEHAFETADTAKLAFAEAMIGNFDWCLKFSANDTYRCDARRKLWNVSAFGRDDRRTVPVMSDFDIAGMVTGRHLWFKNVFYDGFVPSKSSAEIEVLSQVQRTRTLFPRTVLDATRRGFVERKAAAYAALADTNLDASGKQTIETYLNSFFKAIETDAAFYAPVVVRPNTHLYRDAGKAGEACDGSQAVPVGTPVGAPLQTQDQMVQVAVLDALWQWAPPAKCEAIHTGPVWIDKSAIDSNFPTR